MSFGRLWWRGISPHVLQVFESSWKTGQTYTCTDEGLRIRTGTSLSATVLTSLSKGQVVTLIAEGPWKTIGGISGQWLRVQVPNGPRGWAFSAYLAPGPLLAEPTAPYRHFSSEFFGISFDYPTEWGYCYAGNWTMFYSTEPAGIYEPIFFSKKKLTSLDLRELPTPYTGVNLLDWEPFKGLEILSIGTAISPSVKDLPDFMERYTKRSLERDYYDQPHFIGQKFWTSKKISFYSYNDFDRVIEYALGNASNFPPENGFGKIYFHKIHTFLTGATAPFRGIIIKIPLPLPPEKMVLSRKLVRSSATPTNPNHPLFELRNREIATMTWLRTWFKRPRPRPWTQLI